MAPFLQRLQKFDVSITRPLMLPENSGLPRFLALLIAHSGDSYIWIALLAAAWFLGDGRWKELALLAFVGLVLAQIFVVIVKMFVKRSRPQGTAGRIYRKLDPYSFPSGHAARAAILSILTLVMGPVAAFIAIVSWSPIMVLSRIAIGIHYVLDVIAGILLGAALAALVLGVATLVPHRF